MKVVLMAHARVRVAGGPLNRVHIPSVAIATAFVRPSLALACVVKTTRRRLLLAMPVIDHRPLRGWRFLLLNIVLGLGNVLVLSNVPGYTVLRALRGGQFAGRDAELWHLGDDRPYDGHRAGLRARALARGAVRRLPRACRRLCFLRRRCRSVAP